MEMTSSRSGLLCNTSSLGDSTSTEIFRSARQIFRAECNGVDRTVSPSERRRTKRIFAPVGRLDSNFSGSILKTVTRKRRGRSLWGQPDEEDEDQRLSA